MKISVSGVTSLGPPKRTREGGCSKPNKTYEARRQQEETVITEREKRRRRSTRARNIG